MRAFLKTLPSVGEVYDWVINKVTRNYGRRIARLQERVTRLEAAVEAWQLEFNQKQEKILSDFESRTDRT